VGVFYSAEKTSRKTYNYSWWLMALY
jgi:hypothetical protein